MKIKFLVTAVLLIPLFNNYAFAWNDSLTHPEITKAAVLVSSLDDYLKKNLNLVEGYDKKINSKALYKWLLYGSEMEDDPNCRASNHFHNPYKQWDQAGLTDLQWLIGWWCWISGPYDPNEISSSLVWATGLLNSSGTEVASDVIVRNEWDWSSAREYFYTYLTGKNYQGSQVATDAVQRNEYLIKTLRALGQVMHLLQDAAVPAHVRDDFTQGHLMINPELCNPMKWIGNRFEKYVERNNMAEWFDTAPVKVNLNTPPWRVSDFWDTDQLYLPSESDPPANMFSLGLAEYASMNFFSEYRIFHSDFPYPKPEHCAVVLSSPPVNTQNPLDRQYLASVNGHPGEQVDHLAVVSYSKYFIEAHLPHVSSELIPLYMDENCYYEYAQHLIPRAIGYSSQLLDYFFRGTLEIRRPFIKLKANNGEVAIGGFEFEAKNSLTSEDLISGDLDLVYQYLSADGEAVFGVVNNENILLKSTGQSFVINTGEAANAINTGYVRLSADLDPNAYIPLDADNLTIMLVYSGPLGAETDIAIAVGSHRFDEASLAGNTRWLFDCQLISGLNAGDPIPGVTYPINIHTVLPDGDDMRNLTNVDPAPVTSGAYVAYYQPAWSPDGRMIAYRKNYCSPGARVELYETPWIGCEDYTNENPPDQFIFIADLTEGPFDPDYPMTTLAWPYHFYPGGSIDGIPSSLFMPSFSPDNRYVLAVVKDGYTTRMNMAVFDIEDGAGAYVNGYRPNEDQDGYLIPWGAMWKKNIFGSTPVWSPDGGHIVYYVHELEHDFPLEDTQPMDLYTLSPSVYRGEEWQFIADGLDDTAITADGYTNIQPSWSPDGQWLVFSSNKGRVVGDLSAGAMDLWIMDRNGQNARKIFDGVFDGQDQDCMSASFSPDGMRIVFLEGGAICTVGIDGQDPKIVIDSNSMAGTPSETVSDYFKHLSWSPYLDEYLPAVTLVATAIDGDSFLLTWTSTDADRVAIDNDVGEMETLSGSIEVTATLDMTSFTATAYNWAGKATAIVNVRLD